MAKTSHSTSGSQLVEMQGTLRLSYPMLQDLGCLLSAVDLEGCTGKVMFQYLPPDMVNAWKKCLSPRRPVRIKIDSYYTLMNFEVDGIVSNVAETAQYTEIRLVFHQLAPVQSMMLKQAVISARGSDAALPAVPPQAESPKAPAPAASDSQMTPLPAKKVYAVPMTFSAPPLKPVDPPIDATVLRSDVPTYVPPKPAGPRSILEAFKPPAGSTPPPAAPQPPAAAPAAPQRPSSPAMPSVPAASAPPPPAPPPMPEPKLPPLADDMPVPRPTMPPLERRAGASGTSPAVPYYPPAGQPLRPASGSGTSPAVPYYQQPGQPARIPGAPSNGVPMQAPQYPAPYAQPGVPIAQPNNAVQPNQNVAGKKKIGMVLVQMGYIAPAQLDDAARQARMKGEKIGRYLVRSGMVSADVMCRALALQSGLPMTDVSDLDISEDLAKLFSYSTMMRYSFVPFDESREMVCIAVANPLSPATIRELEQSTSRKIEIFLGREDLILKHLNHIRAKQQVVPRRFIRYDLHTELTYQYCTRFAAACEEPPQQGMTLNISEGGLLMEGPISSLGKPDELLRRGTCVSITIPFTPPQEIKALCRLKAIQERHGKWLIGLEMLEISTEDKRRLKELCVRALLTKMPPKRG